MITPSNWQTLAVLPAWIHQANRECKAHLSLAEHRPSCLRSVLREDITAVHAAWDMVKQRLMFGPWGLLCTVFVTVRCLSKATVCPNYMILSSVQGTHIYLFCVTELLIKMMLFLSVEYPSNCSEELRDLLQGMLTKEACKRMSVKDILVSTVTTIFSFLKTNLTLIPHRLIHGYVIKYDLSYFHHPGLTLR